MKKQHAMDTLVVMILTLPGRFQRSWRFKYLKLNFLVNNFVANNNYDVFRLSISNDFNILLLVPVIIFFLHLHIVGLIST